MAANEVQQFMEIWDREAQRTIDLLRILPVDKYDFRPDPEGRSIGELAWHLAEADGYITFGIDAGQFSPDTRPPGLERPRKVQDLAPGYERVHREAAARIRKLTPADLDRNMQFFSLPPMPVRDLLWNLLLLHNTHHRGQLQVLCRLAGGRTPFLYGPTREELPLPKAAA